MVPGLEADLDLVLLVQARHQINAGHDQQQGKRQPGEAPPQPAPVVFIVIVPIIVALRHP